MIYEFLMLSITLLAGVSLAAVTGIRQLPLLVPAGVLFAVVLRTASFSLLNLFDVLSINITVWFLLTLLMIVYAVIRGKLFIQLKALALIVPIVLVSVVITRVERWSSPVYGDPSWILTMSEMMQSGVDMETLNGRVSIKRGFAFPLMLSLGPTGEYLSAFPAVLFISLIFASYWAITRFTSRHNLALLLALAVMLTTPIVIRSSLYLNGHVLMALAVVIGLAVGLEAANEKTLSSQRLILLMVSLSVISTTRAEGIAVAALVALTVISANWISRKQIMLTVSSATFSFGIWLSVYNSYILNSTGIYWVLFVLILVGLGLLVAAKPLDPIRFRLIPLAIIAELVVLVAALVIFREDLLGGVQAQFENLVLGEGLWGIVIIAMPILLGYLYFQKDQKRLASMVFILMLGNVILKMVDGGQFGEPTLGRVGWADSLNRMWLHLTGVFAMVIAISFSSKPKINS